MHASQWYTNNNKIISNTKSRYMMIYIYICTSVTSYVTKYTCIDIFISTATSIAYNPPGHEHDVTDVLCDGGQGARVPDLRCSGCEPGASKGCDLPVDPVERHRISLRFPEKIPETNWNQTKTNTFTWQHSDKSSWVIASSQNLHGNTMVDIIPGWPPWAPVGPNGPQWAPATPRSSWSPLWRTRCRGSDRSSPRTGLAMNNWTKMGQLYMV